MLKTKKEIKQMKDDELKLAIRIAEEKNKMPRNIISRILFKQKNNGVRTEKKERNNSLYRKMLEVWGTYKKRRKNMVVYR